MSDLVDAINALQATEQPPADELAMAPIIDCWQVRLIDDPLSHGGEYNATGNRRGNVMFTATITKIDPGMRWLLAAKNGLYRLGYSYGSSAPIVRAASMLSRGLAFKCLERLTGRHTLNEHTRELLDHLAISVIADRTWAIRTGAQEFASAMLDDGRADVSRAWRLLVVDPPDPLECGQIAEWLLAGEADRKSPMVLGWSYLARGQTFGIDTTDPIRAAHMIGRRAEAEENAEHYKGGEGTDINDALNDVYVKVEDEPAVGVIVIRSIGGSQDSWAGKPVVTEFKSIVGKKLPLRLAPATMPVRKALLAEFPYAERAIDVLLSDLEARDDVFFRPSVIVGTPGCGKSRLVRRLGELMQVYVGRYDGSASEDNAFGGTARRWSTGEPCWPLNVIRAAGHANPILHVDELDKAATSTRNGSTAYALLPMLDSESSRRYADPYIQSDLDISHVSFLLTVNDDSMLPAPLKDRLRVIRMPVMGPEHVVAVANSIVAAIAAERGVNVGWYPWLDADEREIAQRMIGDGSIRRLQKIVEKLIETRDHRAPRH